MMSNSKSIMPQLMSFKVKSSWKEDMKPRDTNLKMKQYKNFQILKILNN